MTGLLLAIALLLVLLSVPPIAKRVGRYLLASGVLLIEGGLPNWWSVAWRLRMRNVGSDVIHRLNEFHAIVQRQREAAEHASKNGGKGRKSLIQGL